MSVTDIVDVQRYVWGGYQNPQYPIGQWFGSTAVLGDASGGTQEVIFRFQPLAAETLDANLYSCDQLSISTETETAQTGMIRTQNMGLDRDAQSQFQTLGGVGTGDSASRPNDLPHRMFLGGQRNIGQLAALTVRIGNNNGLLLVASAEGYIWGSRVRSSRGGPLYPPGALYRS